jgi:cytochrome c biogenesis protein CcdA
MEVANPEALFAIIAGFGFIAFLLLPLLYFIPAIISAARNHTNNVAILLLNIFLGWTMIAWLVILIWSIAGKPRKSTTKSKHNSPQSKIKFLTTLKDDYILTEEEFEEKKALLLKQEIQS